MMASTSGTTAHRACTLSEAVALWQSRGLPERDQPRAREFRESQWLPAIAGSAGLTGDELRCARHNGSVWQTSQRGF